MRAPTESKTLNLIDAEADNTKITEPYTWPYIWENVIWSNIIQLTILHVALVAASIFYGFEIRSVPIQRWTVWWSCFWGYVGGLGVTAGAHRLWTHRTYRANIYLRIFLLFMYCCVGMNTIFEWVRDHRVHHKFSETNADPHNAKRGFFFSHVGWLTMKRHPDCLVQLRKVDMSDVLADPVVMFDKKYGKLLRLMCCFAIPTAIPVLFLGETILNAVLTQCFMRYVLVLHFIWCVNSVAHLWGSRPYNRLINPAENMFISLLTIGEGSHNYHHTFPWDYKTSEFPYFNFNLTTLFIDAMAKLGWAWDLKVASPELVKQVTQKVGEKSLIDNIILLYSF